MVRAHPVRELELDEPTIEASLKTLRQKLSQLRRQARKLDQIALEECLSLAIELTSTRSAKEPTRLRPNGDKK